MQSTSKELLQLEEKDANSPLKSSLLVCDQKSSSSRETHAPPTKKPVISQVPKSQVLGKVHDFLGVFAEANKKLQLEAKENPEQFDIEALKGNESNVIELDLMLGIADLHTPEAVAAAEAAVSGYQPPVQPLGGDSEDCGDDDDDDLDVDEEISDLPSQPEKSKSGVDDSQESNKKVSKKRSRIVELS